MKTTNGLLTGFVSGVQEKGLDVHAVLVRRHGEIIDRHDLVEEGRIPIYSASKSWTAMAAGIAMDEGLFAPQDKLVDLLDGALPDKVLDNFDRITVERLLTMTSGHERCPITLEQMRLLAMDPPAFGGDRDKLHDVWYDAFFSYPLKYLPEDMFFAYNNGCPLMLSCIIEKKAGMSMRDYLVPRLFEPLGIKDPIWDTDCHRHNLGGIGLHLDTEELSRGGQLLLNGGKWEGKQLISEDFVKRMTTKQVDNSHYNGGIEAKQGYGYMVWMCTYPGAYRMDGMYSQYAIQLPDLDCVIAITSHEMKGGGDILDLVWERIVPELRK